MSDTFREVTSVSWFGRIKRSFGGLVVGLALIAGMVFLLFWNEGRAVQTARSLAEGSAAVVSVAADAADPANDGKLIHISGPLTAASVPADTEFGVSKESVRLVRKVEMYQWIETSKSETKTKLGGGEETVTTYSYSKGWDDDAKSSSEFKQPAGHTNPPMEISGRYYQIPEAKLGGYTLDTPVLDKIADSQSLPLTPDQAAAVDAAYGGTQKVSIVDGRIYLGQNPTSPAVGDYRISYDFAPLGVISVIGQQQGAMFQPYQTMAGDALLMVDTGSVPADKMFADAVSTNTLITWLLRLVGLVLLVIGFALLLAPLGVIADFIPFVGSIVRFGTGLVAFLCAVTVGTITIAVAWFYYRPLLAIGILVAGLAVAAAILHYGRSRRAAGAGPTAAPAPAPAAPAASSAAPTTAAAGAAPTSSKWN
jgi:hypothetical protein